MSIVKYSAGPVIAGIDEAGRGPLAGPVIAAACVLPRTLFKCPDGRWSVVRHARGGSIIIGDSKMLTPQERETAFRWITRHCFWGIGSVEARDIDRIGILEATQAAMQQAVACLAKLARPDYLLVDGRDAFWFDYPHSSIIDGDAKEPAIAAASIIAKVTRDRLMTKADGEFPLYGFARHKGYGTPEHTEAIVRHGLIPLHRRTFLKNLMERSPLFVASSPSTTIATRPRGKAVR